jgi:hypothetical protein
MAVYTFPKWPCPKIDRILVVISTLLKIGEMQDEENAIKKLTKSLTQLSVQVRKDKYDSVLFWEKIVKENLLNQVIKTLQRKKKRRIKKTRNSIF